MAVGQTLYLGGFSYYLNCFHTRYKGPVGPDIGPIGSKGLLRSSIGNERYRAMPL